VLTHADRLIAEKLRPIGGDASLASNANHRNAPSFRATVRRTSGDGSGFPNVTLELSGGGEETDGE